MAQEPIWPGSGSAVSGNTPFGTFDDDSTYQTEAPKFADWCAKRLGYPIMDVELNSGSFYAILEESITEYSAQVNQYNIKDNLLSLQGQSTGSNLTHRPVTNSFGRFITLSEQYGTEAGVGGTVDFKTGSIDITSGSQEYDLNSLYADVSESGNAIEVRKVYYEGHAAVNKYFDTYAGVNSNNLNLLDSFGWGNYSPAIQFLLMPMYADLLRIQGIELNDQIRKSAYSFELVNNKLTIFPVPEKDFTLWFDYVYKCERDIAAVQGYVDADDFNTIPKTQTQVTEETTQQVVADQVQTGLPSDQNEHCDTRNLASSPDSVTDFSNVPYQFHSFSTINDVGKRWIMKYYLSTCKELLGSIRAKYQSIPIPGGETSLDGDALRAEAQSEKEQLITELREDLDVTSRSTTSEQLNQVSDNLQENLKKVPNYLYIG